MIKTVLAGDKSMHMGCSSDAQTHSPQQMVSQKMFWSVQLILLYEEQLPICMSEWGMGISHGHLEGPLSRVVILVFDPYSGIFWGYSESSLEDKIFPIEVNGL